MYNYIVGEIDHEMALTMVLFKIKGSNHACIYYYFICHQHQHGRRWWATVGRRQMPNGLAAASTHQKWWRSTKNCLTRRSCFLQKQLYMITPHHITSHPSFCSFGPFYMHIHPHSYNSFFHKLTPTL